MTTTNRAARVAPLIITLDTLPLMEISERHYAELDATGRAIYDLLFDGDEYATGLGDPAAVLAVFVALLEFDVAELEALCEQRRESDAGFLRRVEWEARYGGEE